MPTLILEGEAYVLAGVVGTVKGVASIKPQWVFDDCSLGCFAAFRRALEECASIYAVVSLLLLIAAFAEIVTLMHTSFP